MFRASAGLRVHVYWVVVQAQRIVAGSPRWKVEDTLHLGIQPRTAADRVTASKDRRLVTITCDCEDPTCTNKLGRFMAHPFPDGVAIRVEPPQPPEPPRDAV